MEVKAEGLEVGSPRETERVNRTYRALREDVRPQPPGALEGDLVTGMRETPVPLAVQPHTGVTRCPLCAGGGGELLQRQGSPGKPQSKWRPSPTPAPPELEPAFPSL